MSIDAARYRQVIGHFATGVTVITTAVEGRLHGMTANALTSLSLDPVLLLICVDKKANAHDEIARAGRFAVNILTEEQEEISRVFAATGEPEVGSLRGVPYHVGRGGMPVLDNVLGYLECDVAQQFEGGDHTIYIGEVIDADVDENAEPPLLFYRGGYRRMGR